MGDRRAQRQIALVGANGRRAERRELRRQVRDGRRTVAELLRDPPAALEDALLYELVLWQPRVGARRLERIGRDAIRAEVNLAISVGRAAPRGREWLACQLEGPTDPPAFSPGGSERAERPALAPSTRRARQRELAGFRAELLSRLRARVPGAARLAAAAIETADDTVAEVPVVEVVEGMLSNTTVGQLLERDRRALAMALRTIDRPHLAGPHQPGLRAVRAHGAVADVGGAP